MMLPSISHILSACIILNIYLHFEELLFFLEVGLHILVDFVVDLEISVALS
jgi:hypothetical protein